MKGLSGGFGTGALALVLVGCGAPARIPDAPEPQASGELAGEEVAVRMYFEQRFPKAGDEGFEVRVYDFDRELKRYLLFQDAELTHQTRPLLRSLEPAVAEILGAAGARVVGEAAQPDWILETRLTFGPTPSPCFYKIDVGKSFAVGIPSFGLAPDFFDIRADYTVRFRLLQGGAVRREGVFQVEESVTHTASPLNFKREKQMVERAHTYCRELLQRDLTRFLESTTARAGGA